MLDAYPPDLRDFVIRKIADGTFHTADEFAVEAASLYRELEQRHRDLKAQVHAGLDGLESGAYIELADAESVDNFFDRIKQRGRTAHGGSL